MGMEASPTNGENFFVGFEPNILDQYDSSTYHFRLFLTRQDFFISGKIGERSDQITVAESGVTGIGIDEVIIEDVHGYSAEVGGSTTALSVKMTLKEPFNANLFDKLYTASLELGIDNYTKCVYFLELTFIGNDRITSQPVNVNNKKWLYPIIITKVASTITAAGTTYEIESVRHSDIAHTDQNSILLSNITIKKQEILNTIFGQGDLEAILRNLGELISARYRSLSTRITDNKWVVSLSEEMVSFLDNDLTMNKTDLESTSQEDYHFSDSTSISKAIDSILASSKKLQEKSKAENRVTNEQTGGEDISSIINKSLYKIHTEVREIAFDVQLGDYIREFKYVVYPYKISTLTASVDEGNMVQDISQQSVDLLKSEGRIRKHYNYLYTGKNADIVDFDLRFNMAWYVNLPRLNRSTVAWQTGKAFDYEADDRKYYQDRDVRSLNQLKAAIALDISDGGARKADKINSSEFSEPIISYDDSKKEQILSYFDKEGKLQSTLLKDISVDDQTRLITKFNSLETIKAKKQTERDERSKKTENINEKSDFGLYVEDYKFTSEGSNTELNEKRSSPITFKVDKMDERVSSNGTGGDAQNGTDDGRAFFSALFAQANKTNNSDLLMGDFNIKGDPFWLQPPIELNSVSYRDLHDSIEIEKFDVSPTIGSANTMLKENFFLFTTYVPNEESIFSDDVVSMGKRNVINGVYGVIKSTSKFSGGQFTQTLHATRHVLSDLNYVNLEQLVTNSNYTDDVYNEQTKQIIDIYNIKTIDPIVNQSPTLNDRFNPEQVRQQSPLTNNLNNKSGGSQIPGNGEVIP